MARDTTRDGVWREGINLAGDDTDGSERGFTKADVIERVDAGERTVHDVLKTMEEYGLLGSDMRWLKHEAERAISPLSSTSYTTRANTTVYYPTDQLTGIETVDEDNLRGYAVGEVDDVDEETLAETRRSLGL